MELKYSRKERIAGFFVIGSILILLVTLVVIGRGKDWFKHYVPYYTTFGESYNLQEDAAVKLLQTNIGKVKKVSLLGDRVQVELLILQEYAARLRAGAVATVQSPTLIGSEYVSIKPGRNKDAPPIPPGGLIPSTPRRSISDLMEEFEVEKTAKMVVKAVQDISDLVHLLRDPEGPLLRILDDVDAAVVHVETIARDLQAGKGSAGSLLRSDRLTNAVEANLKTVDTILKHIETTAAGLPARSDQLGGILADLHSASGKTPAAMDAVTRNLAVVETAGQNLTENLAQVRTILKEVQVNLATFSVILNNMEKASFDIPKVTRSSLEGIGEIRQSVENIDKVVHSLQQNILIRGNLPAEPVGKNTDAGLR